MKMSFLRPVSLADASLHREKALLSQPGWPRCQQQGENTPIHLTAFYTLPPEKCPSPDWGFLHISSDRNRMGSGKGEETASNDAMCAPRS